MFDEVSRSTAMMADGSETLTILEAINAKTQGSNESRSLAKTLTDGHPIGEKLNQYFATNNLPTKFASQIGADTAMQGEFKAML